MSSFPFRVLASLLLALVCFIAQARAQNMDVEARQAEWAKMNDCERDLMASAYRKAFAEEGKQ